MAVTTRVKVAMGHIRIAACTMISNGVEYREALQLFKIAYVAEAMQRTRGNQVQAGDLINMHRNSVHTIMADGATRLAD